MTAGGEALALEAQAEAVLDAIRAAVVRLLSAGGVSPQLVALAVARVAGELGASVAVADGLALERVLGELAGFMRRAGREHGALVSSGEPPANLAREPRIFPSVVTRRG
jgi:hypothetical protein